MKKILITALLICTGGINLFAQANPSGEDSAIYAAVLNDIYTQMKAPDYEPAFVISGDSATLDFVPSGMGKTPVSIYLDRTLLYYQKDIVSNFQENNRTSFKLESHLPADYMYNFVPQAELNQLYAKGEKEFQAYLERCKCVNLDLGWGFQQIRKKYPNIQGVYHFSRAGFSTDKKSAVVFLALEAPDQGKSDFYILEKAGNQWKVLNRVTISNWIS